MSSDPLLQPYRLKHLTLKNRIMSTAHEPAYSEDGMPKERYRLYHVEKAKGGIAMTRTAGSAIIAEDSPAAAVMIQLTHLGRRTGWNKADWLPVLAASAIREPAHRAFPKVAEDWARGLSREEGVEIARRLVASGKVDFLNIIRGRIDTDAALSRVIPVHGMASVPHLDFAGEVRAETRFPVFHAARIADVATARHAIASGLLDMVSMTRAHLADPHIARKVIEGREHEIRPCVGATYCLDRIYEGHEALRHAGTR